MSTVCAVVFALWAIAAAVPAASPRQQQIGIILTDACASWVAERQRPAR